MQIILVGANHRSCPIDVRERLAFRLLVISTILMVLLFTMATRTGILPGVNY